MFQTLSNWRCKCGVRITVIGETLKEQPSATQTAACPKCGDKQMVYADKIISIETEMNESGYGRWQPQATSDTNISDLTHPIAAYGSWLSR